VPPSRRLPATGLARALSKLGYCSRSQAAELIRGGRVRLNGALRRDPEWPVHLTKDRIQVDDEPISSARKLYVMLNKPRGLVTTASDEKNRDTIYSLLDPSLPWVAPVGRLDKASEGVLLLTNDSNWAQRILDPESHLDKTYHVQIGIVAEGQLLRALESGIRTDGELLRAKRATLLHSGTKNSWLEIVLDEGKNRQIRRMIEAHNIEVLRLIRVAIGSLALGSLPKGATRELTAAEVQGLTRAC
jgi:23S rRNA pseudouridine2605 synthase